MRFTNALFRDNANLIRRRRQVGLAVKTSGAPAAIPPSAYLTVSANGRYIVGTDGQPFLIISDSPQGMMVDLSLADMETFIASRASSGFNMIQVHLIAGTTFGGRADKTTFDGIAPFTSAGDIATPNSAYFARVDSMIALAASYNMIVMLTAAEKIDSNTLWTSNGETKCRAFGQYLGNRYKDYGNIVWIYGNDYSYTGVPATELCYHAVCNGIKDYDTNNLHSMWLDPNSNGMEATRQASAWDAQSHIDFVYLYKTVYDRCLLEYALTPAKPLFLGESNYETESLEGYTTTPFVLRKQHYWTMLSGGCGITYCNGALTYAFQYGVDDALTSSDGLTQVGVFKTFFESFDWHTLIPDSTHAIMTAGYGTYAAGGSINTNDYATAAITADNKTFLAYLPTSRQVTIDMSKLTGTNALCRWFNPSSGSYTTIGTYACSGTQNFTPAAGDWVLVLEA